MNEDDTKLKESFSTCTCSLQLSLSTVRQACEGLGWVSTSPYHCRFIGEANKEKQLKWSNEMRDTKKTFLDVISTDKSSVESSQHSLKLYKRKGKPFQSTCFG